MAGRSARDREKQQRGEEVEEISARTAAERQQERGRLGYCLFWKPSESFVHHAKNF